MQEAGYEAFKEFISILLGELIDLMPKILTAVIMLVAAFLVLRFVGGGVRKLLSMADVDNLISRYTGIRLPISFNSVVLGLLYLGIALTVVYGMINLFLGEAYIEIANSILIYGARLMSVIALAIILFTAFSAIIEKIRVESRMKGYLFFIIMLLLTAMLIDVTALSEPVKQSLYTGLSVGIGASLAIFAIWFFFHEYLEKFSEKKLKKR